MSNGDDESEEREGDSPEGNEADRPAAEEAGAADSEVGSENEESETDQEVAAEDDETADSEESDDNEPAAEADDEQQIEADRDVAADTEMDSSAPEDDEADVGPDADDAEATEGDDGEDSEGEGGEEEAETEPEVDADEEDGEADAENGEDEEEGDEANEGESEDSDDETGGEESDESDSEVPARPDAEVIDERLTEVETQLGDAETEADLDDVEERLDSIEADLEEANLPEPDEDEDEDDEEEAEDPRADLESKLEELRDALEDARGPYAEDAVSDIEDAHATLSDTRWTDQGEEEIADAVEAFLGEAYGILDVDPGDLANAESTTEEEEESAVTDGGEDTEEEEGEDFEYESIDASVDRDLESLLAALDTVASDIEGSDLDPDEDEGTIAALLEATADLESAIEESQAYDDLTVREKLAYEGFYDVLESDNKKDFPPEWNAIKIYERQGEIEPILLAFDLLGSAFMEEHCIEAFRRMGAAEAFDVMHQQAQRRNKAPIEALGKIGDDRALETLHPYIEGEDDPGLQQVTIKAIGEIGSEDSTQHVADRLVAENEEVRSRAARALGKIGDTRAISPLADVLRDDESDTVRASAAWALTQIGTEDALDAATQYAEDRSYLVQSEAEWAARAFDESKKRSSVV